VPVDRAGVVPRSPVRIGRRPLVRGLSPLALLPVVAASLLLLLPTTWAAPAPAVTYPYNNDFVYQTVSVGHTGCTLLNHDSLSPIQGWLWVGFFLKTSMAGRTCSHALATEDTGFGGFNFTSHHTGPHVLNVTWRFNWAAEAVVGCTSTACSTDSLHIAAVARLIDVTTNTTAGLTRLLLVSSVRTNLSVGANASDHHLLVNVSFVLGDVYEPVTYFELFAWVNAPPGTSAYARDEVGSWYAYARLLSITGR
jgi:hypothetical protein